MLAELRVIGFDYKLVENGKPKMGRPRKEPNAKAQVGQ